MLNKERILKWAEALESGQYVQSRGCLRVGQASQEYCCLGVACEVFRKETGEGEWRPGGFYVDADSHSLTYLPSSVVKWFGLESPDPYIKGERATYWNDVLHKPFSEIARYVRGLVEGH